MHSVFTKTTCQKSAKSMRYRVSPKFEFYRKSLLTISKKQLMSLPLNLIFFRCIPIIIITDKTACYSVFLSQLYLCNILHMSITWENNLSPLFYFFILTNRTIGMKSFSIGTNPTIGTNGHTSYHH